MAMLMITLVFAYISTALCQFNMTAYWQMPPLYKLDDYDKCLQRPEPASYCLVASEIVPNTSSPIWNQIEEFSSDTRRHFRHDSLIFGVCLNLCHELINSFNESQKEGLYVGDVIDTELLDFIFTVHKRDTDVKALNKETINICLNYDFQKKYNLQLRSSTEYCVSNIEKPNYLSPLQVSFLVLIGVLLVLAVLSSYYDRLLESKQVNTSQKNNFYKTPLTTRRDTFLVSFSLCRNYYQLIKPAEGDVQQDLSFFECFRFISMLLVVLAHILLFFKVTPLQNTEFVERAYHKLESTIILNGTASIQVFFVMSSFLLCVYLFRVRTPEKPGFTYWIYLIIARYLRLAPSTGFTLLINVALLPVLEDGPFWRHSAEPEFIFCKENWWKNIFFINNFTMKKSCLHQTWYIASDFQLYVIFSAVLLIIIRFPRSRNYILGLAVLTSFLSTGLVTYIFDLEPVYQETANSYRFGFWYNGSDIYKGYTPSYMNLGGYVFGIIAGFSYIYYKDHEFTLKGKEVTFNVIFVSVLFGFIPMLISAEIFTRYNQLIPSVLLAIYAAFFRNIWAILCALLSFLMAFKIGSLFYRFSSMKVFGPLGRISFQVYLIHSIIIRCLAGFYRQPIHLNDSFMFILVLGIWVLSYLAGFLICMFFELPVLNLTKLTLKRQHLQEKLIHPNSTQLNTIA